MSPIYLCAKIKNFLLNSTERQNSLERVRVMVFIQAESLQDGNMFSWCPLSIFTFTARADLLFQQLQPDRTHLETALSNVNDKHLIHSQQKLTDRKCSSCCNWHTNTKDVCSTLANINQPTNIILFILTHIELKVGGFHTIFLKFCEQSLLYGCAY